MWKTEHSEETTAPPAAIWRLLTNVEGWSSWNPGLSWARLEGPFATGTTGRTKPAKGPEGAFTIVEVREENSFVNEAKLPGGRLRFLHRIEPLGDGRARVTLGATIDGTLSGLYGLMFGRNIAGYMPTAVKQLVGRAEAGS
ncbi:MAG: SRPBCC family protein [Chloroflexota bacterium]|nr:MAG: hypothetical protein DLM70_16280 [Chloroflexota bacterium]